MSTRDIFRKTHKNHHELAKQHARVAHQCDRDNNSVAYGTPNWEQFIVCAICGKTPDRARLTITMMDWMRTAASCERRRRLGRARDDYITHMFVYISH